MTSFSRIISVITFLSTVYILMWKIEDAMTSYRDMSIVVERVLKVLESTIKMNLPI